MSSGTGTRSAEIVPKRRSRLADFFTRLVKEKPLGTASGIIVLMLTFTAIFANVLAPYPYDEIHLIDRLQAPSAEYLLGTDQAGRDLVSRLIVGARISLTVGLAATALNVVTAVLIGGISGFLIVDIYRYLCQCSPHRRGSNFADCRSGGDRAQCCHRCPDRRHFRIPWR